MPQIDIAIVANPARAVAGRPAGLRLIQSLWAGVDRLLADPTLPVDVPVVRMVDPAMNAAMAETALWAVLALHRDFFDYARQQQGGRWRPPPAPRRRSVACWCSAWARWGGRSRCAGSRRTATASPAGAAISARASAARLGIELLAAAGASSSTCCR